MPGLATVVRFRRRVLSLGCAGGWQRREFTIMTQERFKRRTVLAGLGAGAIGATIGVAALGRGGRPPYTKYTYAESQGDREALRVAWYETYNGRTIETQSDDTAANVSETLDPDGEPLYVADAPGPVIEIENVLPGDSGTLHVGLEAVAEDPVTVSMTGSLDANDENGFTEPELAAGDVSAVGELASNLEVTIWADTGIDLLGGVGACDGEQGLGESTIESGTLETVFGALQEGVPLVECLGTDARTYCLGLRWRLPEGTGNEVQSDGATFTLAFAPSLCEAR
ncbi:MAG: hypothetical protein ACI91T_001386 [Natronomonas sp.]|jgi:hypothetical protein